MLSDGTPDMDSAEWQEYCASSWWGAVQEHELVAGIERAELTELQRLDVEDLACLIQRHADTYRRPRASASTMRIPLLQSLARLVDAIAS